MSYVMDYPFIARNIGPSNVQSVSCLDYAIDFFDITTVYSGRLHYKIDDKDYIINKGDTIIIRPGNYCYRYADNNPAHYFAMNFYSSGILESELPDFIPNCSHSFRDITYFVDKHSKKTFFPSVLCENEPCHKHSYAGIKRRIPEQQIQYSRTANTSVYLRELYSSNKAG